MLRDTRKKIVEASKVRVHYHVLKQGNMKMEQEEIKQRFEKLNVNKKGDKRAVHKPLLILYAIGKLLRGEDRLISYADIEEDLKNLLKEFGPWKSNHLRPQYPFWRLRNAKDEKDIIWEIPNACQIREYKKKNGKTTGDAKIAYLRRYGSGGFLEPIAYQLQKDSKLTSEIICDLLDFHFTFSYHEDILQRVGIELPTQMLHLQPRDQKFRKNVLKAYGYKCAVCGLDMRFLRKPVALEACHIKWHKRRGPNTEPNGLALCSLHHTLFDRGVFRLSPQCDILVSDAACGAKGFKEWILNFHRKKINFPQMYSHYPDAKFIRWHTEWVFKGKPRK